MRFTLDNDGLLLRLVCWQAVDPQPGLKRDRQTSETEVPLDSGRGTGSPFVVRGRGTFVTKAPCARKESELGKKSAMKRAAREAAATPNRPAVSFGPSSSTDAEAILELSRTRLPVAVPLIERYAAGEPSPFDPVVAHGLLLEFTVARIDGDFVGYAYKQPFPRPGGQGYEPEVANLVFLAADATRSGIGIGAGLLHECAVRAKAAKAKLITAHVPTEAVSLYERAGWTVLEAARGFAWQLPGGLLYGDYPKADLPFPHLAYKQLGPIAYKFEFVNDGSAPVHQAALELWRQLLAQEIDKRLVSDVARQQIAISLQMSGRFGSGGTGVRPE